jgi:hypothetical protein
MRGTTLCYVESKTENLASFEGQTVHIKGKVEANVKAEDLPVLVVESINAPLVDANLHIWNIPSMNLRIVTPSHWKGVLEKGVASFTLEEEGPPLMTVESLSESGSTLPEGTSFFIAGRRSVRTTPKGQPKQDIYVSEMNSVIHFRFDPTEQKLASTVEEGSVLLAQFEHVISSLQFLKDKQSTITATQSGSSVPCGGSAGILCPSGFFCNISDQTSMVGQCQKL